jgi:predicted metal-dependent hydrolase
MLPLLRFTLDLFGSHQPVASVQEPSVKGYAQPLPACAPAQSLDAALPPAAFRHPRANREARLCEAVVAYEFKRGKRRTIGFSVGPDGLVVRAPKWVALRDVDAALQEKSGWIIRKLGETRQRQQEMAANRIEWADGASFSFLGQTVTVLLDPHHGFGAVGAELQSQAAGLTLRVGLAHAAAPEQIRDAVQAWLMRQAKRVFTERLNHFAPQLQVQWRKLSLSNAGTRWGSARVDGAIRLNWRLIHFRQSVIDYVVVHELSHLRVMDHSPRFWDTVRSVVPDYTELRGQLKDHALPRWS